MIANFSMIFLVIISNIYNTTPNKQILISYFLRQKSKDEKNVNSIEIQKEINEEASIDYDNIEDDNSQKNIIFSADSETNLENSLKKSKNLY